MLRPCCVCTKSKFRYHGYGATVLGRVVTYDVQDKPDVSRMILSTLFKLATLQSNRWKITDLQGMLSRAGVPTIGSLMVKMAWGMRGRAKKWTRIVVENQVIL